MPKTDPLTLPLPDRPIDRLIAVMSRLRDRDSGCPWDLAQTPATLAPFAVEEAYEVMDAIARDDRPALADELGDLLLQVVFQARIAEEEGWSSFDTIAGLIADKLVRRHPHIFGSSDTTSLAPDESWESEKEAERHRRREYGALAGVALSLPALLRAAKLTGRAARVGFDWSDPNLIVEKIHEEIDELKVELLKAGTMDGGTEGAMQSAIQSDGNRDRIEDELGDVLFTVACLARKLELDPEAALRRSNAKFTRRFEAMEALLADRGETLREHDLDTMDALWKTVKTFPGMG